jgi:hypothetical protein
MIPAEDEWWKYVAILDTIENALDSAIAGPLPVGAPFLEGINDDIRFVRNRIKSLLTRNGDPTRPVVANPSVKKRS